MFQTPYSYKTKQGEVNNMPSETVPDMALTPSEIMVRWSQGRPLTASKHLHYTGDEYAPDMRTLDLTQQAELMEENSRHLQSLNEKLRARRELKRQSKPKPIKEGSSEADNADNGEGELP